MIRFIILVINKIFHIFHIFNEDLVVENRGITFRKLKKCPRLKCNVKKNALALLKSVIAMKIH